MPTVLQSINVDKRVVKQAKLLYLTHSVYDNDWPSIPHSHHFLELIYVINGSGEFLVDGNNYAIEKGDAVVVNMEVEHTEHSKGDEPLEYVVLGIDEIAAEQKEYGVSPVIGKKKLCEHFDEYIHLMLTESREKKENYEIICQDLLQIILLKLSSAIDFHEQEISKKNIHHACIKIKEYMESYYGRDITLDSLSKMAHTNKYYLAHSFKKNFGVSPMTYLVGVRLDVGKGLLENTNYNITEIARMCGFSSGSYFSQVFAKNNGISARDYRRQRQDGKAEKQVEKQVEKVRAQKNQRQD